MIPAPSPVPTMSPTALSYGPSLPKCFSPAAKQLASLLT